MTWYWCMIVGLMPVHAMYVRNVCWSRSATSAQCMLEPLCHLDERTACICIISSDVCAFS